MLPLFPALLLAALALLLVFLEGAAGPAVPLAIAASAAVLASVLASVLATTAALTAAVPAPSVATPLSSLAHDRSFR